MEDDETSPTKNGNSSSNNKSTKSWIHLKWNNPDNVNRISPTKARRPRNAKICRKCGRSYKNNACSLCQKIDCSKIFRQTKLPITKKGKDGAQSSPEEILPVVGGTGSTSLDRRLLKEHWWRCDGPCQYKMPFFGLVRRAINRAPGPSDKWWSSHASTCGGTFIKVKEPSDNKKEAGGLRNGDIRHFLELSKNNLESSTSSSGDSGLSLQAFGANLEDSVSNLENSSFNLESFGSIPEDSGSNLEDSSASTSSQMKRSIDNADNPFSLLFTDLIFDESQSENLKECSFCAKKVKSSVFEEHENECMVKAFDNAEETISCVSCGKDIPKTDQESHLKDCLNDIFEANFDTRQEEEPKFNCPLCMKLVPENFMKTHLDFCLSTSNDPIIESLTFS